MSYILDALKRAEQERQIGQLPNAAISPPPDDYDEPRRWPWIILAVLLLAATAAGISYWLASASKPTNNTAAATPHAPAAPSQVLAATPQPRASLPNRVTAVTRQPFVVEEASTESTVSHKPTAAKPQAAKTESEAKTANSSVQTTNTSTAQATPAQPKPTPKPAAKPDNHQEADDASHSLPWLKEMSGDFRHSVPNIDMQFHRHTDNRSRNFVMVDGVRYREGQILKSGPTIERIVEEGLILRWQGERFVYPIGG